jgi:NADPH:quinone reductase
VPDPVPDAGNVRIAVEAAGVHLIDTSIRQGTSFGSLPPPEMPMTPGREVTGTVDQLGPNVDASWLGRRVVAHLGPANGGYASLAVADERALISLPAHVNGPAAVAMVGTGRTTLAILDVADVQPDDVALLSAASGGTGSLLVQALRSRGAFVDAAAGTDHKAHVAKTRGADVAVTYASDDWPERVRTSRRALDELAAGRMTPLVNPPFRLADAAAAHRALEARATTGKVALVP